MEQAVGTTGRAGPGVRSVLSKVPEITVLFWVAKLLTTGMGEATWDWMDISLGQTVAVAITGPLFVLSLIAQFLTRAYNPWVYWFAVVMVSVFGTTAADLVHNDFGVPYTVSTSVLLVLVATALVALASSRFCVLSSTPSPALEMYSRPAQSSVTVPETLSRNACAVGHCAASSRPAITTVPGPP